MQRGLPNAYEKRGATTEEIRTLLGKGRSKKGIFMGDMEEGELEIGQVVSTIDRIQTVKEVIDDLISDYQNTHYYIQPSSAWF